ncbi:unnamed protein product [Lampetra fluviatilis]
MVSSLLEYSTTASLCVHTTLISALAWPAPPRRGWLRPGHASPPRPRLPSQATPPFPHLWEEHKGHSRTKDIICATTDRNQPKAGTPSLQALMSAGAAFRQQERRFGGNRAPTSPRSDDGVLSPRLHRSVPNGGEAAVRCQSRRSACSAISLSLSPGLSSPGLSEGWSSHRPRRTKASRVKGGVAYSANMADCEGGHKLA